jgi:hypothetical protein
MCNSADYPFGGPNTYTGSWELCNYQEGLPITKRKHGQSYKIYTLKCGYHYPAQFCTCTTPCDCRPWTWLNDQGVEKYKRAHQVPEHLIRPLDPVLITIMSEVSHALVDMCAAVAQEHDALAQQQHTNRLKRKLKSLKHSRNVRRSPSKRATGREDRYVGPLTCGLCHLPHDAAQLQNMVLRPVTGVGGQRYYCC